MPNLKYDKGQLLLMNSIFRSEGPSSKSIFNLTWPTINNYREKVSLVSAIYVRTSTTKQEKGHEAQIHALENYCLQKNITNYKLYEDYGVTGTKSSRPSLNKMMLDCRAGRVNHVIVYSFSRYARSTKHLLESLETFEKLNIRFTSISEDIDTSSPLGRAMFTIISALAALERDILSERTKTGLKNAKAKGKRLGRPKKRNSALIKELHSKGLSQRKIAELTGVSKTSVYRELSGTKS